MPLVLNGNAGSRGDMVSAFFKRVARHFANETAVVTPNGEMLAGSAAEGLRKWREIPAEERRKLADLGAYDAALDPQPPRGGLILKVFARAFTREGDGALQIYKTKVSRSWEPGRDHLWLAEDEWKATIPTLERGRRAHIPDAVAHRIARTCLIDLVRVGGNGGPRKSEEIAWSRLRVEVEEVRDGIARLRLAGTARVADAKKVDDYELFGRAEVDVAKPSFTRFDLLAWSETGHFDEVNDRILPFGVSFELTRSESPADRVAPSSYTKSYFDPPAPRGIPAVRPRRSALPEAPRFPFDAALVRRYQKEYADWLGVPVGFTHASGVTFALVPPGSFGMGSPPDEPGRQGAEALHPVTLTQPFYLGRYEVTMGQFRAFVDATGHVTDVEKSGGGHAHDAKAVWIHRPDTNWRKPGYAGPFERSDDHPVVHVSHADATAFCRHLGEGFALPTEAQWEWACRAGSAARFWWGPDEDTTGRVANLGDRAIKRVHPDWPRETMAMDDGHAFAAPVGSYRPNAFGLHDMLGNVWEFCSTRHGPYAKETATDPGDLGTQESYSVRGGGWSNVPADARSATRNSDPPRFGHSNLGFRVALPLPVPR